MELHGLHHLTAITGNAGGNVGFYTQALGLRMVKKTVNQDDVSAYHLYYGDETGSPGTALTFFDWPMIGAYQPGPGAISNTMLRVPGRAALDWWRERFDEQGIAHEGIAEFAGRTYLKFKDPEGQQLEMVDDGGVPGGVPWAGSSVPADYYIRGLYGATLNVVKLEPTAKVLTDVLGFRQAEVYGETGSRIAVFTMGDGGAGKEVFVTEDGKATAYAYNGIGGVHHVAFRTPNAEEQLEWQRRVARAGLNVSPQIDRFYFKSIYFRIPGGILFEIATDDPGFATDEPVETLGESLALPPFLEPQRAAIEAGLTPIR